MRRMSIFMLVALLAIAGVMGAMAYNEATITSGQTLKVTNTNDALLALKPGTGVGNKDGTAFVENGILQIQFGKAAAPGEASFHGLQPASVYKWNKLLSIQNKSAETVDVNLILTGGAAEFDVSATVVEGSDNNNWFSNMIVWNGAPIPFILGPNTTIDLEFELSIKNDAALGTYAGEMIVNAVAK